MALPQDITRLQSEMGAAVRAHWKAFLFEGILLAILGLAAMIVPPLASLAVTIFLGWMFLISGVAGLMDILIAFLVIAGLPGSAEWAIGLLVGINLVLGGASMVGMALAARQS